MGIDHSLTKREILFLSTLDSPGKIQDFINDIPYSEDHFYRCPLKVLRERKAHCFDGALFSAMALRRIGFLPLILELVPNKRDDDHLLALFRHQGLWGAVAQSNYSGLRFREPLYRSLRELAMSYFEDFFNTAGEKTLRAYRGPINLRVFDKLEWESRDEGLEILSGGIDRYHIHPLITENMSTGLSRLDGRSLEAGLFGANQAGLFQVEKRDE